jgi:hypothetical protein
MKFFFITFITLDGNEYTTSVQAETKEKAILIFETQYEFMAIISCEDDTEII